MLSTWHPLSENVGTNVADKRRSQATEFFLVYLMLTLGSETTEIRVYLLTP
jgi:hypothetical protein